MYKNQNLFFLIGLLFLSSTAVLSAQKDEAAIRRADQMPTLKDCPEGDVDCSKEKVMTFVRENLKFPKAAKDAETGGAVMISYVIEKNGSIGQVEAKVDPGMGMGKEAIRVVQSMNKNKMKWRPGIDEGKKVRVQMVLPVQFSMELEKKEEAAPVNKVAAGDEVLMAVEEMPRFAGCAEESKEEAQRCTFNEIVKHVQSNLKFPAKAKDIDGIVMVSFIVDKSGELRDAEVIQPLSKECDTEALRVVNTIPAWTPGMQSGKKVHVRMNMPIQFRQSAKKEAPKKKKKDEGSEEKNNGGK